MHHLKPTSAKCEISSTLIGTVCRRLSQNKRVRRTLPEHGRLHVDRQLPFLCVYRRPIHTDDPGTERLVKGEASYLIAPASPRHHTAVSRLLDGVVSTLTAEFGAFLIVEVWAGPDGDRASDPAVPSVQPVFHVVTPPSAALTKTVDVLVRRLNQIKVLKQAVSVEVVEDQKPAPAGLPTLLAPTDADRLNCHTIGLIVPPVYRDAKTGQEYPLLMRQFRRSLGKALRQAFYKFALTQTTHRPPHYHELGRRAVVKAVWDIDRRLGEVSNVFDFLLQVNPVNSEDAWNEFKRSGFERVPQFHYRPLPFDPARLKRQLYQIAVERVEDPALQHVFEEKQQELDRKITMLGERDTQRFLYGSLQLYGGVDKELSQLATGLLERLATSSADGSIKEQLSAEAFADRVQTEFEHYRASYSDFKAKVSITHRVAGVMVSRGTLLINRSTQIPLNRVEALLQHEVGTHLLTYYNGRAQPFRQLYSGLAGYDALQEGLAVLAEYLIGGLTRARIRQLAGRVLAVEMLVDGASFVDTFRVLQRGYSFDRRVAFTIAMRVFRGGGLTKDAVYLRGLQQVLEYLRGSGEIDPLLVGKMAVEHIPIIKELRFRNVLKPPAILPRYLEDVGAVERLEQLRGGEKSVVDLVE